MLESITLRGNCGPFDHSRHLKSLLRTDAAKGSFTSSHEPLVAVIESPLSGAYMKCVATTNVVAGQTLLSIAVTVPVMAALDGQNYFHDSVEWLWTQQDCVYLLVALALLKLGLNQAEIDRFRSEMSLSEVRFAWYCQRSYGTKPMAISDFATERCSMPVIELRVGAAAPSERIVQGHTEVYTSNHLSTSRRTALGKARPWLERHQRVEMVLVEAELRKQRLNRLSDLSAEEVSAVLSRAGATFDQTEMKKLKVAIPDGFNGPMPAEFCEISFILMTRFDMLGVGYDTLLGKTAASTKPEMNAWRDYMRTWLARPDTALVINTPSCA